MPEIVSKSIGRRIHRTDILVIGGGVAGLSAAMRFARRARTVVLEREGALGYHSSGRSATFSHLGIGDQPVKAMTAFSRSFFEKPPEGFATQALSTAHPALFIANESLIDELDDLEKAMRLRSREIRRVGPAEMLSLVPALRVEGDNAIIAGLLDPTARKLDSDLLLQSYSRAVRASGGDVVTGADVLEIEREGQNWIVHTTVGDFLAAMLVNAAGAWADEIGVRAGVQPLGLTPLRRTIIGFDPPGDLNVRNWPFTKTVGDGGFYMLPDAGRLLASPMDETLSEPTDAAPEDIDVATAAWRVEEATTLSVERITTRWAGLRTFTRDKVPTAGHAVDRPGFFWLAGQGGYGLQTAPAMALAAEALLFGDAWPDTLTEAGIVPAQILPERLIV